MAEKPTVSLVLVVKDGMPFLKEAIDSVKKQTSQDFEVIIQDGDSTDGSQELLQDFAKEDHVHFESQKDSGIGEAYSRAYSRCQGEIYGSIDADNLLEPTAVEVAIEAFKKHPQLAAIFGATKLIKEDGSPIGTYLLGPFDPIRVLCCELVLPFEASFFNKKVCGEEFYVDPKQLTCVDYDLWIRLSHLPIARVESVLASNRKSLKSSTCRPESYEGFCAAKIKNLKDYLAKFPKSHIIQGLERRAISGIYQWAAQSLQDLAGPSPELEAIKQKLIAADPFIADMARRQGRK